MSTLIISYKNLRLAGSEYVVDDDEVYRKGHLDVCVENAIAFEDLDQLVHFCPEYTAEVPYLIDGKLAGSNWNGHFFRSFLDTLSQIAKDNNSDAFEELIASGGSFITFGPAVCNKLYNNFISYTAIATKAFEGLGESYSQAYRELTIAFTYCGSSGVVCLR